jgi:hypothetical protein
MEIDSRLVMLSIPVAAGKPLHLLDLAVEAFPQGIGDPVLSVGYDIVDVGFEGLGSLDHRSEATVGGPEIPTREILPHPTFSVIVPEVTKVVLDSAGAAHLEVQ